MNPETEKLLAIEKSKRSSIKDGIFANAASGAGENYISAYAVALNAKPFEIGLLSSLPNLIAPLFQLFTSKVMERFPRKKICDLGILAQAAAWLPIAIIGLFLKDIPFVPSLLAVFYVIYASWGNFVTPAWSSWIGDLVNKKDMNRFLSQRNRLGSVSRLVATIGSGLALEFFRQISIDTGNNFFLFIGFAIIFVSAMVLRLVSRSYLLRQIEPEFRFKKDSYFSFFNFLKDAPKRTYGTFAIFVSLIILCTNIVAPYYSLYMLRDLNFSYIQFMLIQVAATIATFIYTPLWGKFADRYGHVYTLKATSNMIPVLCFLWPASAYLPAPWSFWFLIFTNFYAGLAWSGFNLAAGSYIYDSTSPDKRSLCVAYSNILNGIGVVLGAGIGSLIIAYVPVTFINIIMFTSIISGLARFITSFGFVPNLKEVRLIQEKPSWHQVPLVSNILDLPSSIEHFFPIEILKNTFLKKKKDAGS